MGSPFDLDLDDENDLDNDYGNGNEADVDLGADEAFMIGAKPPSTSNGFQQTNPKKTKAKWWTRTRPHPQDAAHVLFDEDGELDLEAGVSVERRERETGRETDEGLPLKPSPYKGGRVRGYGSAGVGAR